MKRSLQFWGFTLLLLVLTSNSSAGTQYFPSLNIPKHEQKSLERFADTLRSHNEPPLWPSISVGNRVSFRLIIYIPKGGGINVYILNQRKNRWLLTCKLIRYTYSEKQIRDTISISRKETTKIVRKKIYSRQVKQFSELFNDLEFWKLPSAPPLETIMIFDGSTWVFEAVANRKYNCVWRISPSYNIWVERNVIGDLAYNTIWDDYPKVDRDTHLKANKRLVEVCEFLMKLSGIELPRR